MSYLKLRGRWCDIIVLNVHNLTEDKINDMKGSFYEELEHVFDKIPEYHTKILLGDVNTKIVREDIFKPTTVNNNLYEISNDNGVGVVNLVGSKNLTVRRQCSHIATFTNLFGHLLMERLTIELIIRRILVDRRRHSRITDVRHVMKADCDTDQYLAVEKFRGKLRMSK
jgi:exonuclease III